MICCIIAAAGRSRIIIGLGAPQEEDGGDGGDDRD
jgi:hypothetical protein